MENVNQAVDTGFEFVANLCEELNNRTLDLPAFPDVAVRIRKILRDPEITADQVARVVGSDPVFSARLLKVANSALMNAAGAQINDLRIATMRLGFNMAYNIAVSVAVEQVMKSSRVDKLHPYLKELWKHSVRVAAYSYVIADRQTGINPDEAMLAGMLHDIGKFYILNKSGKYPELFNQPETLDMIMQDWHTAVGRSILDAWKFSEDIAVAADEHESLERMHVGAADLTDVVMVANLFAHQQQPDQMPDIDWEAIPAIKQLKLTAETACEIIKESRQEMQSIIQALQN
jgi:putative nucleotidyltransferase with HDIG domain